MQKKKILRNKLQQCQSKCVFDFYYFLFQFQNFIINRIRFNKSQREERLISRVLIIRCIFMLFSYMQMGLLEGGGLIKRQRCKRFKRSSTSKILPYQFIYSQIDVPRGLQDIQSLEKIQSRASRFALKGKAWCND